MTDPPDMTPTPDTWTPDTVDCPRCGALIVIIHDETDVDFDDGIAVCPYCRLERCAGAGCWCLETDGKC